MKRGRKPNAAQMDYVTRYSLTEGQRKRLRPDRVDQLERCKDESARRLLLGVSRRKAA